MELRNQIKQVNTVLSATLDLYRIYAKKHNLNYNTLVILYTLYDNASCTQKQISNWWALPKQTVHGILQDFEKEGYITIIANEQNKRERLISFTQSGLQYASSILEGLHAMEDSAMKKLGSELRQQLINSNKHYYELLKEEIDHG